MRAGRPVVLATKMPESVYRYAEQLGAQVHKAGREFQLEANSMGFAWTGRVQRYAALSRPALLGAFQLHNAAAVLEVCECLSQRLLVTESDINRALQSLQLAGRMQIIPGTPSIILDVAHNPQAIQSLRDNLNELSIPGRLHGVFGILGDKDLGSIIQIISPAIASWHLVDTSGPRGQSAEQLLERIKALGIEQNLISCGSLSQALHSARRMARAEDTILVFGSFLVVGEFLETLNKKTSA